MSSPEQATTEYLAGLDGLTPEVADEACRLLLDRLAPRATTAWVDAFSDATQLTAVAERARMLLLQRRPNGMGIELDPRREADLSLLRDFAYWSICVELHAAATIIASIHDRGDSLWFRGEEVDAAALRALGVDVRPIEGGGARRWPWRRRSRRP